MLAERSPYLQLSEYWEDRIGTKAHKLTTNSLEEGGYSVNDADYDEEYVKTWYSIYSQLCRKKIRETLKKRSMLD